jgi:hypothetical protein|tara:strand:- start:3022 stop:3156 length:135 start_codon:yes stop_codon:yes gene_type:complete
MFGGYVFLSLFFFFKLIQEALHKPLTQLNGKVVSLEETPAPMVF